MFPAIPHILRSKFWDLGPVVLPPFANRQKYMHSFDAALPVMPEGFEDYLEPATKLIRRAGATGMIHMTVDEKVVQAGMSQRRPKPHVDGCYASQLGRWSNGWLHGCNHVGAPIKRMAIIVAATVEDCRAWEGVFDGAPADDGDLAHIQAQLGEGVILPAHRGFLLSPDCVHESIVFERPTQRQFLRLAFSAWRVSSKS